MKEQLYFAYGSNMNLDQMEFRCPQALPVGNVRLEGYRLTFCGRENGVATIVPEKGSHVDGVLWKITRQCEKSLDRYEGYPHLYGKQEITVTDQNGTEKKTMVYVMNAPYKDHPAPPSDFYLAGILEGCRQNGIPDEPIMEAVKRTEKEIRSQRSGKTAKAPSR